LIAGAEQKMTTEKDQENLSSSALPYWLALLVLVGASYGGWKWWQVEQFRARGGTQSGGIVMDGPPLDEFELTECNGQPFRSQDMLGKVWVTTFFFTTCPGACPRLNANIRYLNSLEEIHDVVWVSITVDPDTDTLPVLRTYAEQMQADPERWLFCRGDLDYVQRIGHDIMKLQLGWKGHQDYAVVVDRQGEIRGMFDATSRSQSQRLRTLLLKCLAEKTTEKTTEKTEIL
jgi:protein SCO1/2